ncbi:beta-monoglucosyldiacylglycerol synthase [Geobacter sp. OR-1]|uniref:glycosyltransferase family 2 protein n=1 Tax=Geobacter sp. OR-1 TaxID=1266765 RepID=UPI000543E4EB|nr:glycosyltransferase family 2 protein [Geobacter sp. OR-1]GAM08215.1 beta-monoglucosyldiacylglycerol synthase [Geobacter sp. OR-1]
MKLAFILAINCALCLLLVAITLQVMHEYLLLFAALFLSPSPAKVLYHKKHRFLVLVPAHNEQRVIGYLVDSLQRCDYPPDLIKICVIADNCTDDTANVACMAGATVLERQDLENCGKSCALLWALSQPIADSSYDSVVIFDADNLVHADFFNHANNALNRGIQAFQAVVETKNRLDSWVTAGNYVMFSILNRITQAGRSKLGLGAHLFGTGMGFSRDLLEKVPWTTESITEDKEYTYRLLLSGIKVEWLGKAIVYDEKTTTAKESFHQQKRWLSGYYSDFRKYAPLMVRALKCRFDWSLLDALYHMVQPLIPGKNISAFILLILLHNNALWIWWFCLFLASFVMQLAGLALNQTKISEYRFLCFYILINYCHS